MKSTHLTTREYAIMKILWENNKPMLVSEIIPLTKNISLHSMHPLINSLMAKGFVKVVGNVKVVKAPSRLYEATVTMPEYAMLKSAEIFSTNNQRFDIKQFMFYLVKRNKGKDQEIIRELEEFIQNYKEENNIEG